MRIALLLVGAVAVWSSCARIGSPVGGAKDELSPKIISSLPENYTTSFSAKKIDIEFDEFIQLKDIAQELLVSPPMKKTPRVINKGKTITIELPDSLLENTTYTLHFGKAITDNNEGNILKDYKYVFSTGGVIDSFGLTGKVVKAFDLKPNKELVHILVYTNLADSAFRKEKPLYIGRADAEGNYQIDHLRPDTFRIFALVDGNSNLYYDDEAELYGFTDSLVILSADNMANIVEKIPDTTQFTDSLALTDSATVVSDTLAKADSLALSDSALLRHRVYRAKADLVLFVEEVYQQYLVDFSRDLPDHLQFIFAEPVTDPFQLSFQGFEPYMDKLIQEIHPGSDTIQVWFADSALVRIDTCTLLANYFYTDSLGNYVVKNDTLRMRLAESSAKEAATKPRKEKESKAKPEPRLSLTPLSKSPSTLELNQVFGLLAQRPIARYNSSYIIIQSKVDTIFEPVDFRLIQDTIRFREFRLTFDIKENLRYKIEILPGAFIDFLGNTNDTLVYECKSREMAYYGKLLTNISGLAGPALIQLLDDKEMVLAEKQIENSGIVVFDYLHPKKYLLKAIFDDNHNGVWDAGNALRRTQPEKVTYYKGEVNIRANWDLEIEWKLVP